MSQGRGGYQRGHNVPCKHCGYNSAEHVIANEVENDDIPLPRFRISLKKCAEEDGGYEPKNKRDWERGEREYQSEMNSYQSSFPNNKCRPFMFGTFVLTNGMSTQDD